MKIKTELLAHVSEALCHFLYHSQQSQSTERNIGLIEVG